MYPWCKTSKQQYVKFYYCKPCSPSNKPAVLSQKQKIISGFFAGKLHTLDYCPGWR
jgi:hypothetical protein